MSKKNIRIVSGTAIGLLAVAVIFFLTYFHVDTVEVMGSNHYTEDEIKEMVLKGPLAGNSILAPLLYTKEGVEDIPFVEGLDVSRVDNHTICISVQEISPVGCIRYLDCYMYFDSDGIIVASSTQRDMRVPFFEGLDMSSVALGDEVPFADDSLLSTSISLSRIFSKNESVPNYISVDNSGNITILYGEITAQLGDEKYLEDKMTRLIAILPKIEGQKGILHLENVSDTRKTITFEKELTAEEIAAQEAEKEQEGQDGEEDSDSSYDQEDSDSSYDSGDGTDSSGGDGSYDSGSEEEDSDSGNDSGYDSGY